jgi:hypothetical protein
MAVPGGNEPGGPDNLTAFEVGIPRKGTPDLARHLCPFMMKGRS